VTAPFKLLSCWLPSSVKLTSISTRSKQESHRDAGCQLLFCLAVIAATDDDRTKLKQGETK
jgi:hypothetical protein